MSAASLREARGALASVRRAGRLGFAAAALLGLAAPVLLASQGCSNIIGAGDYHVSNSALGCTTATLGLPANLVYDTASGGTIVNVGLVEGGKPDTLRELRGFVGTEASTFALAPYESFPLSSCVNCVWIYEWDASDLTKPVRAYVGIAGSLTVSTPSTSAAGRVGFELSNVRFQQTNLDLTTYTATLVPDGACVYVASASVATGACSPSTGGCDGGEVCAPSAFSTKGVCQPGGAGAVGAACDPAGPTTGCANGFCDFTTNTCNQACDFWGGVPACAASNECSVFGFCYSPTYDPAAVGADCTSAAGTFCGKRGALLSGACADKGAGKITCEKICRLNGTDCPTGKTCKSAGLDPAGYCE